MKNFEEFEFNNFKYKIDYLKNNNLPEIIHEIQSPEFLYKFYSLSKYNIDALIRSYLYASHPIELNDILDSSPFLIYTSKPISFEKYKHFYKDIFKTEDELKTFWENDVKLSQCKNFLKHAYNMAFNLLGIISLTAKENNTLMWPHYTQEKGIQIKFKTVDLISSIKTKLENEEGEFFGFHPVNYVKILKPIDVAPFSAFHVPFAYASNVKSLEWQYESEWRILASKKNMGIPYSKSGLNTFPDHNGIENNRQIKYDINAIEEICVGLNFITARDFELEWLNDKEFTAQPRKSNLENYQLILNFLQFVILNLPEKFFFSGAKYELDEKQEPYLIRTKEKIKIEQIENDKFKFIRTNEIIKLIN